MSDAQLRRLVRTIVAADDAVVFALLATKPGLVKAHFEDGATRQIAKPYHIDEIEPVMPPACLRTAQMVETAPRRTARTRHRLRQGPRCHTAGFVFNDTETT